MRLPLRLCLLLALLPPIVAGILPALAQGYSSYYPQRAPYGYYPQAPRGYYAQPPARDPRAYPPGYYPGKLVQPAQPPSGFSLRRLFGVEEQEALPPPVMRRRTPVEVRPSRPR